MKFQFYSGLKYSSSNPGSMNNLNGEVERNLLQQRYAQTKVSSGRFSKGFIGKILRLDSNGQTSSMICQRLDIYDGP